MKAWDADPIWITVAPVGAEVTRADHPGLPHTPTEVIAASLEAVAAGASIVHLHAGSRTARRAEIRRCSER